MDEQDHTRPPPLQRQKTQTRLDKLFGRKEPDEAALLPQSSPHLVALLLMSFFGGLIGLALPGGTSKSVDAAFVSLPAFLFYLALVLPAGLALLGLWKRDLDGLFFERVGLLGLTFVCIAYTVAVVGASGYGGIMASIFFIAFAVANVFRVNDINRELLRLRKTLHEWPADEPWGGGR